MIGAFMAYTIVVTALIGGGERCNDSVRARVEHTEFLRIQRCPFDVAA